MVSEHARGALERKGSAELLELRRGGTLTDEMNRVLDDVLRARGIDPSTPAPASSSPTKPVTVDPLVTVRRVRAIAWFQLLAAVAMVGVGFSAEMPNGTYFWPAMALFTLVPGLNIVAGLLTLRGYRAGYWLSIWNHVAQIPVIGLPGFVFHYMGLGGLVILLQSGPQMTAVRIHAQISPGFLLAFGATPHPYYIGIDFLAVGIVGLLLSALRLQKS